MTAREVCRRFGIPEVSSDTATEAVLQETGIPNCSYFDGEHCWYLLVDGQVTPCWRCPLETSES